MPQFATQYEILRGVSPSPTTPCVVQPSRKPLRVAVLLKGGEAEFVATGLIAHHKTLFLEDRCHDWRWDDNSPEKFYYFGHAMASTDVGDIVAIFEIEKRP